MPTVVIVGRPNVGKSTLFNRLVGKRVAVVEDTPGITRDRLYAEVNWNRRRFNVVDTGGIVFQDSDPLSEQIRVQANVALTEADVVLFITDVTDGLHPDDRDLANQMRGIKTPVLVAVNKADNFDREDYAPEFYALGLGNVYPISALHGTGVADVLDEVVLNLPPEVPIEEAKEEIRLAIVGRPNVGKSSLVNAFTGEQRMIVSNIAGTTRDAIDTELTHEGEQFRLIDTAGIRRRGKIQGSVEYYMVNRAEKAIARCECAMVVVNGEEGLTDGDKRVMKLAHDAGKACVIAVNKWDVKEPPNGHPKKQSQLKKDFTKIFRDQIPELAYAPIVFTSAKENAGLEPALDTVLSALESYNFRISTGQLNRLVQDAIFDKPHVIHGRPFKVYYSTQVATCPPTFVLFCNDPDLMHFSYQRYLLNKIRALFPLQGTPIRLFARSSHKKNEED
ncbi:MAG: ribosome biogenesis GTPase Der [Fimbriimonas sp.]|jgi:GTP-binding protein|nr:ribosome biogenesis GTPase Der [Fimbriimonas sp.]